MGAMALDERRATDADVGRADDAPVVLAEDPPAPPPRSASPSPAVRHVRVICSDLSTRSVPVTAVETDEPGELVELANGTCVIMGPNGAMVP